MKTRCAGGTLIELASGDYKARIVTVGAGLSGLTLGGRDLVLGHDANVVPEGYLGKTLMPWPNRIAGGAYTWKGARYPVPVNEPETGSALHGLMCWVDWNLIHADSDSATLGAFIAPRAAYPWALESWVTYALSETRGLTVTLNSTNVGTEPAPYGVSSHPYLTLDLAPVDSYELTLPAATILEADERMAPIGRHGVDEFGFDYRTPRLIGAQAIDHGFTDLPEGGWSVSLRDPETGFSVSLSADVPWVQIYTADSIGRNGVAVEPMTCPANAFNSGTDVIELAPQESHTMTYAIRGTLG